MVIKLYFNEQWLPIKGYEGIYMVSNYGRIMCLDYHGRRIIKILRLTAKSNHYIKVGLRKDGKTRTFRVHRLVAAAFLPLPQSGENQVDHINGDKQDNRAINLRYVNPKTNSNNPNTLHGGYHLSDEVRARMSIAQKKRFKEHPEDLQKMWDGRKRWRANKLPFTSYQIA